MHFHLDKLKVCFISSVAIRKYVLHLLSTNRFFSGGDYKVDGIECRATSVIAIFDIGSTDAKYPHLSDTFANFVCIESRR